MDERFELEGIEFVWNREKSLSNLLYILRLSKTKSESYRRAKRLDMKGVAMKTETLKKRLVRNRPMVSVTLRMPEDVVEDLKKIAPLKGLSGYQPLIRAYIGQCLRKDMKLIEDDTLSGLVSGLKRRGVSDSIIEEALAEASSTSH